MKTKSKLALDAFLRAREAHSLEDDGAVVGVVPSSGFRAPVVDPGTSCDIITKRNELREKVRMSGGMPRMVKIHGEEEPYIVVEMSFDPKSQTCAVVRASNMRISRRVALTACEQIHQL